MGIFNFGPEIKKLKENRNVAALIKIAEKHENIQLRIDAIEAIGEVGDSSAIIPLLSLLSKDEPSRQDLLRYVITSLEKLHYIPTDDEDGALYWVAKEDWERASTIGVPALDPLLNALDERLRTNSSIDGPLGAIKLIGKPAMKVFIRHILSEHHAVIIHRDTIVPMGMLAFDELIDIVTSGDYEAHFVGAIYPLLEIDPLGALPAVMKILASQNAPVGCGFIIGGALKGAPKEVILQWIDLLFTIMEIAPQRESVGFFYMMDLEISIPALEKAQKSSNDNLRSVSQLILKKIQERKN